MSSSITYSVKFDDEIANIIGNITDAIYHFNNESTKVKELLNYINTEFKDDLPAGGVIFIVRDSDNVVVNRLNQLKDKQVLFITCHARGKIPKPNLSSSIPQTNCIDYNDDADTPYLQQQQQQISIRIPSNQPQCYPSPPIPSTSNNLVGSYKSLKEQLRDYLLPHQLPLRRIFKELKPVKPIIINKVDLYAILASDLNSMLMVAALKSPPQNLREFPADKFLRDGAKKFPMDLLPSFGKIHDSTAVGILRQLMKSINSLINKEYYDGHIQQLVCKAFYSRRKRSKAVTPRTMIKKLCQDGSKYDIDDVIKLLRDVPGSELAEIVRLTSHIRVAYLDNRNNSTKYYLNEFIEDFPCFKDDITLLNHDYVRYFCCKHTGKPVYNFKSCLHQWSAILIEGAKLRGFESTNYNEQIITVEALFFLIDIFNLTRKENVYKFDNFINIGTNIFHFTTDDSMENQYNTGMINIVDNKDSLFGYTVYININNDILHVKDGDIFDGIQSFFEVIYLFDIEFEKSIQPFLLFLEYLCNPLSKTRVTAGQRELYLYLKEIAESINISSEDNHIFDISPDVASTELLLEEKIQELTNLGYVFDIKEFSDQHSRDSFNDNMNDMTGQIEYIEEKKFKTS